MFEQMGYKHTGLGILTLEGPIDPDKVSSVSRDAIVAFVECQVMLSNFVDRRDMHQFLCCSVVTEKIISEILLGF